MASTKDIRSKIISVGSTQKITTAMQMVAASKMRKVQQNMLKSRPYAECMRQVISHVSTGHLEFNHPYLEQREVKRVAYIIVSSDRGLCGGLNSNLFRQFLKELKKWHALGVAVDTTLIGSKAIQFFKKNTNVIAQTSGLGDQPKFDDILGSVGAMLEHYDCGNIDRLYLMHNCFINTIVQKPMQTQLLPFCKSEQAQGDEQTPSRWDYIYEQTPKVVLNELMRRYVESQVYQATVENACCEQASRMVSMKSATDNATQLIERLELVYNKARQAAITQELSEIVAGAQAV